jgi:site-specific recombinase XerD
VRVNPYYWCHAVAKTLVEKGMTREPIQTFLGHAKLKTTPISTESTTAMIRENYRKAMAGQEVGTWKGRVL